ncbi:MAG: hypothetical protein ACI9YB_001184, partial [Halioglobus sp.]
MAFSSTSFNRHRSTEMIQLKLSEEEMTELNNGRYEHPDPTIQK